MFSRLAARAYSSLFVKLATLASVAFLPLALAQPSPPPPATYGVVSQLTLEGYRVATWDATVESNFKTCIANHLNAVVVVDANAVHVDSKVDTGTAAILVDYSVSVTDEPAANTADARLDQSFQTNIFNACTAAGLANLLSVMVTVTPESRAMPPPPPPPPPSPPAPPRNHDAKGDSLKVLPGALSGFFVTALFAAMGMGYYRYRLLTPRTSS